MPGRIVLLREKTEEEKMAPQMQVIYDLLAGKGVKKEVDRDAFVQELETSGKLTTTQAPARVFGYYLPQFIKLGLVDVIKPEPAPKTEKEDKGAKNGGTAKEDKPPKAESPANSSEKKPEKAVA